MNTSAEPFSILQISDLHVLPETGDTLLGVDTEHYFRSVIAAAHQRYGHFDLILASGDLTQQPCVASYQRVHKIFSEYDTPTVCLPGNHDDYSLMQWLLNKGNISCNKQTLLAHWQIICLNTQKPNDPGGRLTKEELAFLKDCLEQNTRPHVMVAQHHHCVPSESEWLDTMLVENSADLFDCLNPYPEVKLISTGHVHQAMSKRKQGIKIISSPSTCFQFKPKSKDFALDTIAPGYRFLQLHADGSIQTKVHRLTVQQPELHRTSGGYA